MNESLGPRKGSVMCPRSQGEEEGGAIFLLGAGLCLLVSWLFLAKAPGPTEERVGQ